MPWYWILIILSAIIGPFEAMHALNKARRNREEAEKRRQEADRPMKDDTKKDEEMTVNGKPYRILRLLGHGKGGYSYLAEADGKQTVLKQIHHEPCDYYTFGNKIEAEKRDYERLKEAGIRIPQMLDIDEEAERIVKEFIDGETVFDLVRDGRSAEPYLDQVREMAEQARKAGLNIDYFPTNFVIRDGLIWYVDYECNEYMEKWDFEHWGIRYWARTPEFLEYLAEKQNPHGKGLD